MLALSHQDHEDHEACVNAERDHHAGWKLQWFWFHQVVIIGGLRVFRKVYQAP
jgi:hypothetical protein